MSIESFARASVHRYNDGYYNKSLCLICTAIDALAAKKYPNDKVSNRYKKYLADNFKTISKKGMPGISCSGIRIKVNVNIESLKTDSDGYVDFNQILYHVIRCSLVHDCRVEDSIVFTDETVIGNYDAVFKIPKAIICGLTEVVLKDLESQP